MELQESKETCEHLAKEGNSKLLGVPLELEGVHLKV